MKVWLYNKGIKFIKARILYVLFMFQGLNVFAQIKGTDTNTFTNQISIDTVNQPTELIYLQTSKGIYETGEDLWFKAYILDAQYFVPSGLSQTLYLQLVNEKTGKVYWQEMYEIQKRFASGHVYLQDTLPEGSYLLEAFTPHSFFNDCSEFESSRRVVVRKDMNASVTVKAEFIQPLFAKGDSVGITIHVLSEQSKPLYAKITAELKNGDEILETVKATTNEEGNARIMFHPENTAPGLKLKIAARHTDATENLELTVPYHEGSPIQFSVFPEGGYLISGLENTLAFKAVNIRGEPVEVQGTLFENGDSLVGFKSFHAGMGSFDFLPDKNKKYYIRLNKPALDSLWQLPEIKEEGIVFHLAGRDSNFLYFEVKQKPGAEQKVICLRGQSRGNVYYVQSGVLKDKLEVEVAQKDFPWQGIAEFTLLNENFIPIAERLVYVNPEKRLYIKAELSKKKYPIREKATLNIKVTDEYGRPVVVHLGVSVFDKIYQNSTDTKNIFTHCYLSTQLKGKIYDPVYYFDEKNNDRLEALDLLLLTQGWRRYVWNEQDLEENNKNTQRVVFDGIKGTISFNKKKKKVKGIYQQILVFNSDDEDNKYSIFTGPKGTFITSPTFLRLGEGGYIYLKPVNQNYNNKITVNSPFDAINSVLLTKDIMYPMVGTKQEAIKVTRFFVPGPNVIKLEEVTVKGKQQTQFRDKYLGKLDSLEKYNATIDFVGSCGKLNCPGCKYGTKPIEGKEYWKWVGGERRIESHPFSFNAHEFIKVIYHYPKFTEEELLKLNNLARIKGYYAEREFYQPNYDATDSLDFIPDYRNTLLWAPNVLTDRSGEATIDFFCSDIYTDFIGIIECVSGGGKLGNETFEFKVLKTGPFSWEK